MLVVVITHISSTNLHVYSLQHLLQSSGPVGHSSARYWPRGGMSPTSTAPPVFPTAVRTPAAPGRFQQRVLVSVVVGVRSRCLRQQLYVYELEVANPVMSSAPPEATRTHTDYFDNIAFLK